ncbi:hypothetical protein L1286_00545 [Pseudoalteromonas sp. SMS1]|uniref:Uncharacterized protein n=1 Tax=Pseudoalteromonas luteoviolacea DSM 6061 TaxID=1365250 RepID=A0A166X8S6_9GAMM|nr:MULTISPECIES: hypothetical protein [Pseudoalteromonas]KZN30045.1 hypothetical protein N480_03615 [Pseudoalteromonas luteoviolacea S2607]KZN30087.1 hypothetical protein N480_03840 [Pseudoalteromonas luteoviolacea S2607]KZN39813.1 hypothetical protein N475_13730 [Pseudoalteromonas luteoviolacea DSM 6061]MBE0385752.1 hypothetical protein [Pseudoalteromonas luteoviolacea DSM 6061]MCF2855944.1 hypothetical protein [Pseudoalteromonas sp. SMS1]
MTPEQENQLFQSIGQIQATQTSILNEVRQIKTDLNARVDKLETRVEKIEDKVTHNRIKIASMGGGAGLVVAIAAEALKLGGGS